MSNTKYVDGPIRGVVNVSEPSADGQSVTLGSREWLVLTQNDGGPKLAKVDFPDSHFVTASQFNTKAYGVDDQTPICAWATAKRLGNGVITAVLDNGDVRRISFTIERRRTQAALIH
jgi:hypothetical protein